MSLARSLLPLAGVILLAASPDAPAAGKGEACAPCHADFSKVLPKGHPEATGTGLGTCVPCHAIGQSGEAAKNPYSTRLHLTHAGKRKQECTACHSFAPKQVFGLVGLDHSWGTPGEEDFAAMKAGFGTWAASPFTDHLHAKAGVDCAGCHGKAAPVSDSTVENDRCLSCHGPAAKLAARSANAEFPKRNPHDSHLGADIACTTCHKAHAASVVYCADCHRLWKLTIPGGAR